MTRNRLSDLNDHLFAAPERLSDEGRIGDRLDEEVKRAYAIVSVVQSITANANQMFGNEQAKKLLTLVVAARRATQQEVTE